MNSEQYDPDMPPTAIPWHELRRRGPIERALKYPYHRPGDCYQYPGGQAHPVSGRDALRDRRVPVLAHGSNRFLQQLRHRSTPCTAPAPGRNYGRSLIGCGVRLADGDACDAVQAYFTSHGPLTASNQIVSHAAVAARGRSGIALRTDDLLGRTHKAFRHNLPFDEFIVSLVVDSNYRERVTDILKQGLQVPRKPSGITFRTPQSSKDAPCRLCT